MQTFFRWMYLAHQFCLTWISQDSQVKFMSKEHLHFMWENFMWKVKLHIKCIWYDFMVSYLHKCFHVKLMWENFKWNSCEVISIENFTVTGNSCECPFHKKFIWRTSSWHWFLALHIDVLSVCVCVCRWSACISPTNTPVSCTWAVFWWMSTEWRPPVNPGCYTC